MNKTPLKFENALSLHRYIWYTADGKAKLYSSVNTIKDTNSKAILDIQNNCAYIYDNFMARMQKIDGTILDPADWQWE